MSKVEFRDRVKIKHIATGKHLHSHNFKSKTGSHQQEITCYGRFDNNDWFEFKGKHESNERYNCKKGKKIKNGKVIRLEHVETGKNLHSHSGHRSQSSKQQEVTGFGTDGIGDGNDNWKIEFDGKKLTVGLKFKLVHVNTNHRLHSHNGHKTGNQQEVTCFAGSDDNDYWEIIEIAGK
ncbi:dolichyl-phosphate-mannose--protein mannosyltransferase [Anaeramoeba flamelloides]|uniref:Dolichyl-phosphate-mannose--protein mannosyltransferase n=1 Tax=Anaeramoeba flamelloides TaxID=1746091 RepID=A0ABQ8YNC0_9EUKA|nr:dolichyl-phosphate-mannose--protein mannosyltransferase [Anaeramoeba flamelloides]